MQTAPLRMHWPASMSAGLQLPAAVIMAQPDMTWLQDGVGSTRQELAELTATLAELFEAHATPVPPFLQLVSELQPACSSLIQLLLMCYGASLTPSDKAILQAILSLNRLTHLWDQPADGTASDLSTCCGQAASTQMRCAMHSSDGNRDMVTSPLRNC